MFVAGFNNCKVSDYKATIWTWTLTRDAWGCEERDSDPASCSGLKARGARSECGENNFPILNVIPWKNDTQADVCTLKPNFRCGSEDDCEYWWPELSNYPVCVNISRHINCETPCPGPAKIVTIVCPPSLKISKIGFDFILSSNSVEQTTKPHNLLKTDRAEN